MLLNYLKLDSGNLHVKGSRGSGPEPFKPFFHHLIPMGNRGKVNVEKLNCPNNPLIAVAVACRVGAVQKWRIEIKFAGLAGVFMRIGWMPEVGAQIFFRQKR